MPSVYTASTKKLFPSLLSECLKKNIFSAALINRTFGSVAYLSNYSMHLSVSVISPKAEKTAPLFKLSWHLPTTFNFICSLLLSNLGRKISLSRSTPTAFIFMTKCIAELLPFSYKMCFVPQQWGYFQRKTFIWDTVWMASCRPASLSLLQSIRPEATFRKFECSWSRV